MDLPAPGVFPIFLPALAVLAAIDHFGVPL
jgi:hypothetical protein